MRNKFYLDGSYNYMWHENHQVKWGVITYLIRRYAFYRLDILDIGCGLTPVKRWLKQDEVAKNTMIEQDEKICADLRGVFPADTVICADYEKMDFSKLGRKFNCIVWAGIESEPGKYFDLMSKFIGVMDINAVFVLDYMAMPPETIGERIGKQSLIKKLIHLNGVKLICPYMGPRLMSRWPKVNERRIEIFRLR